MNGIFAFGRNRVSDFWRLLGLFTFIVLINILTLANVTNVLITLPQYFIVLLLIVIKDLKKATLFHFSFFILSLSAQKTLGMMEGDEFTLFNYGTIKLLGPVRAAYVVNIILLIMCNMLNLKPRKDILFYKLYRAFLYMGGSATLIGLIGILINPYYTLSGFIGPVIYMFVTISTCYILLCQASDTFIKSCYYISIISTMAGVFASFIGYTVFNIASSYSVFKVVYCADCMWFFAILIAGILSIREKIPLLICIVLYGYIATIILEGKSIFNLLFAFICLAYYVFLDKNYRKIYRSEARFLRPFIIVAVIVSTTFITFQANSLAVQKIQQALSLFSTNMDSIESSPYIRIASLANVIYEGFRNPFILIFGNGYGGYFTDDLNLFAGMDLTGGAWQDEVVRIGRFPKGHDTMVNVPFFNGLIGVYLVFKIFYLYIKRIKFNFMNSVAFMWIFLMLYFNTIFAVMGAFFLLGAEYDCNHFKNTYKIKQKNGNINSRLYELQATL